MNPGGDGACWGRIPGGSDLVVWALRQTGAPTTPDQVRPPQTRIASHRIAISRAQDLRARGREWGPPHGKRAASSCAAAPHWDPTHAAQSPDLEALADVDGLRPDGAAQLVEQLVKRHVLGVQLLERGQVLDARGVTLRELLHRRCAQGPNARSGCGAADAMHPTAAPAACTAAARRVAAAHAPICSGVSGSGRRRWKTCCWTWRPSWPPVALLARLPMAGARSASVASQFPS